MNQLSDAILGLSALCCLTSCHSYDVGMETYVLAVKVDGIDFGDTPVEVLLRDQQATLFVAATDADHVARFVVPAGIYQASVSQVTDDGYFRTAWNGSLTNIVAGPDMPDAFVLDVTQTRLQTTNPIVIKEVYCGGCRMDDGSGVFARDKAIILYNNSSQSVSLAQVAIGMAEPYNAEAGTHAFLAGGQLQYEPEGWLPAINGIWYFPSQARIAPYSELVINVCGAIDNTLSYSQSVNYAHPGYYCMYDPEAASPDGGHYNNTTYYPSPSEVIPTSHYLRAVKFGQGNAWPLSQTSPALFLFATEGIPVQAYAADEANLVYPSDKQGNRVYACLRVPREWVIDGVEIFNAEALPASRKRLTSDIDNGYALLTHGYGHAIVRRTDDVATRQAGHLILADTNNSTVDFYETDQCSLR